MNWVTQIGPNSEMNSSLRDTFMRWQCRVRQIAMREYSGQPDVSFTPSVYLKKSHQPLTKIITVLSKLPAHSKTPELRHIFKHTNDPAQRRGKALQFLSETYYQRHSEFADMLTATFIPNSVTAKIIESTAMCKLIFEAYCQRFELVCAVNRLNKSHANYQATWWHNVLFNQNLDPETIILGFVPEWNSSSAFRDTQGTISKESKSI